MNANKVQVGVEISKDNKPMPFNRRKLNPEQNNQTTTKKRAIIHCRNSQESQEFTLSK